MASGRELRETDWRGWASQSSKGSPWVQGGLPTDPGGRGSQRQLGAENEKGLPPPAGPVGPRSSFPLRAKKEHGLPTLHPTRSPPVPRSRRGDTLPAPELRRPLGTPGSHSSPPHSAWWAAQVGAGRWRWESWDPGNRKGLRKAPKWCLFPGFRGSDGARGSEREEAFAGGAGGCGSGGPNL